MEDKDLQKYIFEASDREVDSQNFAEKDSEVYKAMSQVLKKPHLEIPEYFSKQVVTHLQQKENIRLAIKRAIIATLISIFLVGLAFTSLFLLDFNAVVQNFVQIVRDNYLLVGLVALILAAIQIIDKIILVRTLKVFPF